MGINHFESITSKGIPMKKMLLLTVTIASVSLSASAESLLVKKDIYTSPNRYGETEITRGRCTLFIRSEERIISAGTREQIKYAEDYTTGYYEEDGQLQIRSYIRAERLRIVCKRRYLPLLKIETAAEAVEKFSDYLEVVK